MGRVRAILWQHLQATHAHLPLCPASDPNDLVDAAAFASVLGQLSPEQMRDAAHAYTALWRRTFKTLVRHLRGRPRRALGLFVDEVHPFLRGTRLAARTEGTEHVRVITPGDLPSEYEAGLIESFVATSGAHASAEAEGAGAFRVQWHIAASDRLAVVVESIARLRVPLLLTATLAALVGVALAIPGGVYWLDAVTVVLGTLAAQAGANAVHDLRRPTVTSPTAAPGLPRWMLWSQFGAGLGVATAAMARFLWLDRWAVLAFAAVGVLIAWTYGRLRDTGLGPLTAAATHGPIIVWGTLAALGTAIPHPSTLALGTLPTTLLAAAIVVVDDLADRPLDEASGHRTLVVRLPPARNVTLFAVLMLAGVAATTTGLWLLAPALGIAAAILFAPAIIVVRRVATTLGDPRGLAPARLATVIVYATAAILLVLAHGVFP